MTASAAKRWTQYGLIALVALMPLHAIAVISLGHFIGHQNIWAAWKEVLIVILVGLTAWQCVAEPEARAKLRQPFIYMSAAFTLVAAVITLVGLATGTASVHGVLLGGKDDLEFLIVAVIALVVVDPTLIKRLVTALLISSAVVVAFGYLQITVLPHDFLSHLGYTGQAGQAAAFETVLVGSSVHYRYSSTLGGPNQLGTFLILPLVLTVLLGFRRRLWWLATLATLPILLVTYSRGAWIGAVAAVIVATLSTLTGRARLVAAGVIAVLVVAVVGLAVAGPSGNLASRYLHHSSLAAGANSSDSDHVSSLRSGLSDVAHAWYGKGLGSAGPATFHDGQIHIIENNYLQIGYETGILGILLFIGVLGAVILTLHNLGAKLTGLAAASAVIGVSVTALVLPAWTDSSTALTVWTIAGASLGLKRV